MLLSLKQLLVCELQKSWACQLFYVENCSYEMQVDNGGDSTPILAPMLVFEDYDQKGQPKDQN